MSTKTTIKRIALVAVSALALGTVSSVSANAAPLTPFISSTSTVDVDAGAVYNATALTAITATNAPGVSFSAGLITGSVSSLTVPASTAVVLTIADNAGVGFAGTEIVSVSLNGQPYAGVAAANTLTTNVALTAPATAGTYSGVVTTSGAASIPFTLVVGTAAGILNYKTSKVFIGAPVNADITSDATTLSASATAVASTAVAQVSVHQFSDLLGATATANLQTAAMTAVISGAGAIGLAANGSNRGSYVAAAAGVPTGSLSASTGVSNFYVFPDSRTGKATITVSVNGVVVSTKTYTFTGATASIKQDVTTVAPKKYIGVNVNNADTLYFNGIDANGNVSEVNPAALDYAISSDATVASVSAANGVVSVLGLKAGTATITVCDTASCVTPTLSASTTVTVTGSTLGSVVLAFDSSSYEPGTKMTLTATAKDAAGLPLADGTYDLFGTVPTANINLASLANLAGWVALSTGNADVAVAGGVATWSFYAPFTSGSVVVSGTDSLTAGNALTATASVVGPTDAAIDAANEATDAANAATDAANAAAEAADAATAAAQDAQTAVADLATKVAALMAGIKAQITSLTNLIVKIQKKVKA